MTRAQIANDQVDVAVVGGGPAGLAAATRLRQRGIERVVVLEREGVAGGIPRHCGHPPFGLREFKRCLRGPDYAARLVARALAAGVEIRSGTTVTHCGEGGQLTLSDNRGVSQLQAKRVLLATGVRETPRAARLVGGTRPLGVLSTGALQSLVYLKEMLPFRRPLIVGSELVSFSALLTCRHAGIRPVAMLEANERVTARSFCRGLPTVLGVPLLLGCKDLAIEGQARVTGARYLDAAGHAQRIACDGILFTGCFTPEATLIRMGALALNPDSGGPWVDSRGRCSDRHYYAAGNMLHPVETAGWCWAEGCKLAENIAEDLLGQSSCVGQPLRLERGDPALRYVVPNCLWPQQRHNLPVQLRFAAPARGRLTLRQGERLLWSKTMDALPERRVLLPEKAFCQVAGPADNPFDSSRDLTVGFDAADT